MQQIDGAAGILPYGGLHHESSVVRKRTRTVLHGAWGVLWGKELGWLDNMR